MHGDVTVHSSAQIQLLNKNTCSDTNLNANTTRKDEEVVGCKVMLQCEIWLKGDRCSDVFDDDLVSLKNLVKTSGLSLILRHALNLTDGVDMIHDLFLGIT